MTSPPTNPLATPTDSAGPSHPTCDAAAADAAERVAVVIEDDAVIRNLLETVLGQAGFTCLVAEDGLSGIEAIRAHHPILTTLDISLPGMDGFEVARRIRAFSDTYIVMLTARDEEIDALMGLDAGADEYLTKPFRPRELRARIEAMLRRYHSAVAHAATAGPARTVVAADSPAGLAQDTAQGWLEHNGLRINAEMWLCDLDGAPVELTRSEFDLLLALMQGKRRVLTKDGLAMELRGDYATSGYVSDSDRRTVEVHMANLRRKLGDSVSAPRYIETVRGVGYRLAKPQP